MPARRRPRPSRPHPRRPGRAAAALTVLAVLLLGGCAAEPGVTSLRTADTAVTAADPGHEAAVEELAAGVPGELGLVVLDPDGRPVVTRAAERPFTSASLYKLFVAHAVLERVDRGEAALTDPVPGTALTVAQALDAMITWSDNASGAALGGQLGWDALEDSARAHGFTTTTFDPGTGEDGIVAMTTTPDDVADLLERLRRGRLLSPASTELFLGLLRDQHLDYALSSGLSEGTEFAHKTGLLEDVSHDAGLLRTGGREHVVVVLTDGWDGFEASRPWFRQAGPVIEDLLDPVPGT
ncbi:serine hydrolase [Kocuria flava]|uniref:serine hydrolase n=1 Tax=Kocuria flava TaxID=446860 RepID=UPI003F19E53C